MKLFFAQNIYFLCKKFGKSDNLFTFAPNFTSIYILYLSDEEKKLRHFSSLFEHGDYWKSRWVSY